MTLQPLYRMAFLLLALLTPLCALAQAEASQSVTIPSDPGVTLAGALRLPPHPYRAGAPAVLLLGGGGPSPKSIYPDVERRLLAAGIATLSFDKRGIGQSTGTFIDTMDVAERDAAAALQFLRSRPGIDPARVAILGLSQGGAIGPRLAVRFPPIAALVLLAAPAGQKGKLFLDGMHAQLHAGGMTDHALERIMPLTRSFMDARAAGLAQGAASPLRAALRDAFIAAGWALDQAMGAIATLDDPVLVSMYQVDASATLAQLEMPVLALYAGDDTIVSARLTVPEVKAALRDNPDATIIEVPGLNHGFQVLGTDASGKPERKGWPVSAPQVVDRIEAWLVKQLRPQA